MKKSNKERILVTGGAGFIGSNLVEKLLNLGKKVIVFDNLSTGRIENIKDFFKNSNFKFIKGDLRDQKKIEKAVEEVDFIFHQAAIPSVSRSILDPKSTFEANTMGTLNLLLAAKNFKAKKIVYASSSSVYGPTEILPKKENMPPNPVSPYALSKFTGEKLCQIFSKIYGLPTTCLRYFNVFGPRQNPKSEYAAVIPKFISAFLNNERPIIYGDGLQSRDFCVTGDTFILMDDFSWKPIRNIKVGDKIISFDEHPVNKKRRFKISRVRAVSSYISSNVYEIKTEKRSVKATGNHPWLMTKRGYRNTVKLKENMKRYKNQKLRKFSEPIFINENMLYKIGYINGTMDGDGYISHYKYPNRSTLYKVALEVTDKEFRDITYKYFKDIGLKPILYERQFKYPNCKRTYIVRSSRKNDYYKMLKILKNKKWKDINFCRGYLASMFDSEGEFEGWQLRISNKKQSIIDNINFILKKFDFKWSERKRKDGLTYLSILGGLNEHIRFFSTLQPKIIRKRPDMNKREVKGSLVKIISISKISDRKVYNIEVKGTHTYIANGFLCHNTYVENVVEANLRALHSKFNNGEVFNIACGNQTSLLELLDIFNKIFSKNIKPCFKKPRPGDIKYSFADISKAKNKLGYLPKISLAEGLKKTIDWFLEYELK